MTYDIIHEEPLTEEEEAAYQKERWDSYEERVKERITVARSMINGRRRQGEAERRWLDQFAKIGHGVDLCCGSMLVKNAMGVDIEYLGPLCFGRTSGDNLAGLKSKSADFIVTNYFDVFPTPIQALNEWHRVLRPGGTLAFVCRNAEAYDPDSQPEGPLCNTNRVHCHTPLTLRFYLNRTGYDIKEILPVGTGIRVHAVRK